MMSSSEMLSRCFTSARRLLPCAAMITRLPLLMLGTISSFQYLWQKRVALSAKKERHSGV